MFVGGCKQNALLLALRVALRLRDSWSERIQIALEATRSQA
jgi:hypothetical protein